MTDTNLETIDKQIVALWKKGFSGSHIGTAIGISRNAVMGRVYRMRKAGVDLDSRTIDPVEVRKKNYRKPYPAPKPEPLPMDRTKGVSFWDVRPGDCKYVLNDGPASTYIFCGAPADTGVYCKEHHRICYIPPEPKRNRRNSYQKLTISMGKKFYDDPA